ncbi:MAG: serine--tRNA ligase [Phenylobacterium sp.]|uniref:serine--tRNA ligase n=1 Tax=Phenylobacterium sp. TaxID=1871053 RepID=UPI00391B177A
MHDIKAIRDNPDAYDRAWASKGLAPQTPAILELDARLRAAQTALQNAQSRRNEASKLIGQAKARKDEAEAQRLMAEVEALKATLAEQGDIERETSEALRNILATLPNLPAADVPLGEDEHGNVEVRRWGEPFAITSPKDHVDLGEGLGLVDFEAAARMSGARFVVLKGQIARLERALGQFMLDLQTREHGYTEVSPPLLVNDAAAYGTDKLPKFADDLFQTTDGRWLIPTAEVPLTSMVMGQITPEEELPLRMTALTPCFRSEAGASGRDTRGMIRQHQFYKVELVSITAPDKSEEEHERMVSCAEAVLKALELPFRTMLLCTGDMGFGARKTYDLEVWLPSQGTYREISSCSNCGDFQARRMDARTKAAGEKGTRFVHSLNGSGLAVGRTLVAVMENYQDENGRIAIPQALHPYLPGMTHIEANA